MTDTEIAAMGVGRTMDAAVAERVMGLIKDESPDLGGSVHEAWLNTGGMIVSEWGPPPYSTAIALAWRVLNSLEAKGFRYQIHGGGEFGCLVKLLRGDEVVGETIALQAPEAICRIALKFG